ncbi:conjugal transfer protein TraD [Paracoccus denitrificans]|uniref:conjugal transfer protein TraD n=1 Tax=Paracoccus denitrificans TaxID=266 RepID=UPI001E3B90D1|nr:conjugal transfer protein TraD [Paracoccus denitrificans]UFS67272.1 conjugal transfer protein TraD [Paracoccus denitrificans]
MDRAVPHRPGNNTAFRAMSNYPYRINDLRPGKDTTMRKPRDYDAELKALEDKARELKTRKVQQLGELVIATGADGLTADELAGALVALAETKDPAKREAWAKRGSAFFQSRSRRSVPAPDRDIGGTAPQPVGAQPASGGAGAA